MVVMVEIKSTATESKGDAVALRTPHLSMARDVRLPST
jgi:hypothetical protein